MSRRRWSATWPLLIGFAALGLLVGVIGVWSVEARIAGAVISPGMIQVENNRQVIQHPQGGKVGAILVKDGDNVAAGDILLELDSSVQQSELRIIDGQLLELQARRARLEAERDELSEITFPANLTEQAATNGDVADIIEGQRRLFITRTQTLEQESSQIDERIAQARNQIEGVNAQLTALGQQQVLTASELANDQRLLERGLIQAARVSTLQREEARLLGEVGNLEASVARLRGQIAAFEIEKLRLGTARREDAITRLRDLRYREQELIERGFALREQIGLMDIRSPVAGVVYGSHVFSTQAVVSPAEPIMYIIPQDQPLVVASRIPAIHIDQVHVGQDVSLRFTAFDQRQTPEVFGYVARVSADVFTDERTGQPYYSAELLPDAGELAKLDGQSLLPGMPVEAFIRTTDRSPLSYLTKPLMDYFNRAFREG